MISCIYRYMLTPDQQNWFENLVKYLDSKLDSNIPLTFMLGFFVSFVVGRWGSILNGIGWIDDASILFASYIRGGDESTRVLRRNLVRYLVLCQALVLRDISMQVRKRFPTMDTLAAAGLMTEEEMEILDEIKDPYSRYWAPVQWSVNLVYECKAQGKIDDYYLMNKIVDEISKFRHGLAALLKYDWVPVPLVYPQVIFLAVRFYFVICLFGRQFIVTGNNPSGIDLWLPITTMIQFIVYMGWMKVAEALLNPLGEDDDDLECNYVIDKNLITGYSMVEENLARIPEQKKDNFWGIDKIAPLYSIESAERSVHPLVGSASKINLVKNKHEIVMTPHKNKLSELSEEEQKTYLRRVGVSAHNARHHRQRTQEKANSPDTCLSRVRTRSK
ncbi:unnamed protein product [Nippostrongylus brasiliensis]|uniref:Bestrophin homolog n=1 Tax=Nippostrongylus brasiliensis TaxID=27835 RepID=A0A0N4YJ23_NIPBR|nr:unnamed protein product [Nippostrongylus brasiliensis]